MAIVRLRLELINAEGKLVSAKEKDYKLFNFAPDTMSKIFDNVWLRLTAPITNIKRFSE